MAADTPLTRQLATLYHLWNKPTPVLFDPVAVTLCFTERFFRMEQLRLEVDDRGLTREVKGGSNARVATAIRREEFLRWYVDRQAQRARFIGHLSASPGLEKRQPSRVEIACFRVVQEALTNVARHARAQRVDVELRECDGELQLTIHDDGVGFDVEAALEEAARGKSLGLLGMQEWVRLTGGAAEISSAPGEGVSIHARFPRLESPSAGEEDAEENWH